MKYTTVDGLIILKLIDIVIVNKIFLNSIDYSYCILIVFEIVRIIIN